MNNPSLPWRDARHVGQMAHFVTIIISLAVGVIILVASLPSESDATQRNPSPQTLTFTPVADARVEEFTRTTNYGPEYLETDNDGVGNRSETYLKFDVSGVSGTVTGAKVRLYATGSTVDGPAIWAAPNSWTEGGITWNNKPQRSGGIADDKGNIPINSWVEFNVSSLVTGNGTYSFNLAQSSADGITFYQREFFTNKPQLVITTAGTTSTAPSPTGAVLVGAGDIATDGLGSDADKTAQLVEQVIQQHPETVVFTTGDNAYPDGSVSDFQNKYHPTWGRFKSRTNPTPGNHEYHQGGAKPYFGYFGGAARPGASNGNYSYELGSWHIIALNSGNCGYVASDCAAGSTMIKWLEADLATNNKPNVLAYMHHPLFSSDSQYGDSQRFMRAAWDRLYAEGADIVIAGHAHDYERFAPQTPSHVASPSGIREFVVGTGGASLRGWGTISANSQFRDNTHHGVLKLTLRDNGYDWQFLAVGRSVPDSGSASVN
jgi:acid phosphatase type 7